MSDDLVFKHDHLAGDRVDDVDAADDPSDRPDEADLDLLPLGDDPLVIPCEVPQSSVVMTTSCATSASLRVR